MNDLSIQTYPDSIFEKALEEIIKGASLLYLSRVTDDAGRNVYPPYEIMLKVFEDKKGRWYDSYKSVVQLQQRTREFKEQDMYEYLIREMLENRDTVTMSAKLSLAKAYTAHVKQTRELLADYYKNDEEEDAVSKIFIEYGEMSKCSKNYDYGFGDEEES